MAVLVTIGDQVQFWLSPVVRDLLVCLVFFVSVLPEWKAGSFISSDSTLAYSVSS